MALLTALEQHIAVRDGVQKISSSQVESFYPEEIDYHLNKAQDVFMDELTSVDFSNPIIRNEYFQNMIVRNRKFPCFIPQSADAYYEEDAVYAILPADYLYHVGSRAGVQDLCNTEDSLTEETTAANIVTVEFPVSDKPSGPYYRSTEFMIGSDTYTSRAVDGYSSPQEYFEVVSEFLSVINREGKYNLYWEYYDGQRYPGAFIIASGAVQIDATYDNPNTRVRTNYNDPSELDAESFGSYAAVPKKQYGELLTPTYQPTFLKEPDDLYDFKNNVFFKSKKKKPYATIAYDRLYTYLPEKSIIGGLRLDYIRRPQRISLALNNACELSGNAVRRIVDLAVQRIKLETENPSVSAFQQEQQLRENH